MGVLWLVTSYYNDYINVNVVSKNVCLQNVVEWKYKQKIGILK